jgi:hypothetical protein
MNLEVCCVFIYLFIFLSRVELKMGKKGICVGGELGMVWTSFGILFDSQENGWQPEKH